MTAIIVSFVGVLGTLVGAALTAFITARSQQRSDAALERQQVLQEQIQRRTQVQELQVEHQRWRRERRQAVYLSFLTALGAADRSNQALFRKLQAARSAAPLNEACVAEIRQMFKDAEDAGLLVLLEGPETVAELARCLIDQFSSLVQDVQRYAEAHAASREELAGLGLAVHDDGMAFLAQRNEFLTAARNALDEVVKRGQSPPGDH
ncbi:hypothetical protein [Streptomyces sp. NPDC021224]|uniref:hypothetical protein n=1 Tax=unclassified Streptomyces TaxID=2593676 RepID=UPI0037A804BF